MPGKKKLSFIIILITILVTQAGHAWAQTPQNLITPKLDSIIRNTLDYLEIKNSLVKQQYAIGQKEKQLNKTLSTLNKHNQEIANERMSITGELNAINRHIDSLIPPRPAEKRPKANFIDIINQGLHFSGNFGLNINQLALSHWAAGGESSSTGKAFANLELSHIKRNRESKLNGQFAFGISHFSDKRFEKADDKIDLSYSYIHRRSKWMNFSIVSTFNTQFADGYTYPNDSVRISSFFAPAYLTVSAGYTLTAKKRNLQLYMSPMAGKMTFVMAQELADQGKYGVKPGYYTPDSLWVPGENQVAALGANIIVNYKQAIGHNIHYNTVFNIYYNYSEVRDDKRIKIDFNWENSVNFTINKHLSAILFVHMKYDHNTTFPIERTINGELVTVNEPKIQIKESLGIAFMHKF